MNIQQEVECGRAGTQGRRTYAKADDITITCHDEWLGDVTFERFVEVAKELVGATEFVAERDNDEAEVSCTFGDAEVEAVRDNRVVARWGNGIGITLDQDNWNVEPDRVEYLVEKLTDWHNSRCRSIMVER